MSSEISGLAVVPVVASGPPARGDSQRAFALSAPPSSDATQPAATTPADPAQLKNAVDALNQHYAEVPTDLKFSIEKDLDVIVVAVIDAKDGTVLRQIPSEEALSLARSLQKGSSASNLVEAVS